MVSEKSYNTWMLIIIIIEDDKFFYEKDLWHIIYKKNIPTGEF